MASRARVVVTHWVHPEVREYLASFCTPVLPAARAAGLAAAPLGRTELLATSDVVVLTLPLTPATRHLVDVAALAAMRPGSYLVNVGRGSVVDEEAVADSVRRQMSLEAARQVRRVLSGQRPDHAVREPAR